MKSYNHLYEVCISESNRREAIKAAKSSKRIRKLLKKHHMSDDYILAASYDWIVNYANAEHTPVVIHEGTQQKERNILVPTISELIVQHCVVNALKPMFWKGMYEHSYASLPKRGSHKGKKTVEKWIKHDRKNVKYVLKMDIRHFFDSIPHDILKSKLSEKIHDERMLDLLFKIIDVTDVGLPLGFYTSQWFSNWYLQELDHYIKEELHAVHYIRYMDDMVIFGSNKKNLHQIRLAISDYLGHKLGLELKSNWQVYRFSYGDDKGRDLDFMGFRFYREKTTLRRSIMLKMTRKARKIAKKKKITIYDARQMVSYIGWLDHTNSYNVYLSHIKPFVSLRALKHKVSQCAKRDAKQLYLKLVSLYTGKGGKRYGNKVPFGRKYHKTVVIRNSG